MTLLIDNDDVRQVLTMRGCIEALEAAFIDHASGDAVNRPRSHTYTDLGAGRHYLFKSMDGSMSRFGVHALRLSSDLTHEFTRDGKRRREKIAAAPGSRYVGLVMLFDIDTLVPLAIIHDGYLQRMRVGATSAVAARYLARDDSHVVGLIGSGWQAGAQLLGLAEREGLEECRVYSPNRERLAAFCAEHDGMVGPRVTPVSSAQEAIQAADIVALATNSLDPVLQGSWLAPGQHVGSVQGHELDQITLERASTIVVRSREQASFHHASGRAPIEAAERKQLDATLLPKVVELGEVVTGKAGRRSREDITLFTGGGTGGSSGLGIQFAAVGHAVYKAALEAGVGRELPTEWFIERDKP